MVQEIKTRCNDLLMFHRKREHSLINIYFQLFSFYTFPYFIEKLKSKIGTEGIELPVLNLIFLNADVLNQAAAV